MGNEKLGRFGHHPDPANDFCIEVECIEAIAWDRAHGIENEDAPNLDRRIADAMEFRVGGDPIAVNAKHRLREIERLCTRPARTETGKLREVLEKCRDRFREYEADHNKKASHAEGLWGEDCNPARYRRGLAGADREMAELCEIALSLPPPPGTEPAPAVGGEAGTPLKIEHTMPLLQLCGDLRSFQDHFEQATKDAPLALVATAVWELANHCWVKGYDDHLTGALGAQPPSPNSPEQR